MQQQRQQQQSFPTARRAEIEPAGATTTAAAGSSLMEVSVFMTEQLKEQLQLQRDHDEKVRAEMEAKLTAQHALQMERNAQAKTDRAELEAKFEARLAKQRCDMVAQVEALEAKLPRYYRSVRKTPSPSSSWRRCSCGSSRCTPQSF
jgi:hypothetical protein